MSERPQNRAKGMSVVIPVWNSLDLVRSNLPSSLEAARRLDAAWEVLLVDDGSTDGTADFVRRNFPEVRVIRRDSNGGFSAAVRTGVEAIRYSVLYLLNSDAQVEPDAFAAVWPHFEEGEVFAAASMDVERPSFAVPAITNRLGLLGVRYLAAAIPNTAVPVLFATGGHSAYDMEKFLQLGGFDDLYAPFYWEDIDICVRAWARSWKVLVEPKSRVRHHVGGSVASSAHGMYRASERG